MSLKLKFHFERIAFEETGKSAAWMITPLPHPQIDAAVYQFAVELQIGIHITLMRDVMGPAFVPDNVTVTHCASESHLLPELVGCPILVDQPANQIVFDAAWLDRKAMLPSYSCSGAGDLRRPPP